ncbi:MAG: outer membrane beta-barrel protein, partial [Desulfuromonadales bacterium]|nr:outer membrane beta-barrel protein [Desulfuromonadales bacterium]
HARVGYAVTFPGSYDVDAYKTELAEAGIVFKKRAILGVHVRAKRDHYFEDNNEDESLRSTIRLDVPLSKRVWMDLTGDWSIYKFEPEDITDRRYGAGVGLYRVFRWGEAGILYRYNEQDSDDNSRDYASNYVRLYLNIPIY